MIKIVNKEKCCGCEACVQICAKHCISFDEDSEGFRYPKVDMSLCVDCGLCEKVCPVLNPSEERVPEKSYAARNDNESELLLSSSGGMFVLLAKSVIRQGGVVFGAMFDEEWNVVHGYAETENGIKSFMGSKYVQSRIGFTYTEVRDFLKQGRKVLFSGTSCQIAGLKRFLRKDYDNLLTVDVICHGVPSPKVWRMYLDEIKKEAAKDAKISDISFRNKRLGWRKFSFVLNMDNADKANETEEFIADFHRDNPYMKAFLANLILRPSCAKCPAKGGRSQSDITLADFWGIWNVKPEMYDDKGTSLVLVNSLKGENVIKELGIDITEVEFERAIASNHAWNSSVLIHPSHGHFFKTLGTEIETSLCDLMVRYSKATTCLKVKKLFRRIKIKIENTL